MNENELELLRALEAEAEEDFREAQARSRERHGGRKATDPTIGPQERFELQRLAHEVARLGTKWRGRIRAREKAEHELAVARVRAASNLDEIEALDAEIAEQMPLSYRPEIGGRVFELRKRRASLAAEYDALLEREIAEVKNATTT